MRSTLAFALLLLTGCACNTQVPVSPIDDAGIRSDVTYPPGVGEVCGNGIDDDGDGLIDCADLECQAGAPVPGDFLASYGFLFEGSTGACAAGAAQSGYVDGTIDPALFAVVRGRVIDRDTGAPISSARVFVQGEPDLGEARTQPDGVFDLAVNAGSHVLVSVAASGRVPIQRAMPIAPHRFTQAGDLALTTIDPAATVVHFGGSAQTHLASVVTDDDGVRRSTVVFPSGVHATVVGADGTTRTPDSLTFHSTELTVGLRGEAAMPALLPSTTSYTYGVEVSADEVDIQTESITFSAPVSVLVDNFLGFPVGTRVPLGTYDRVNGIWHAEPDGRVIRVLSVGNGQARVDSDGDGAEDTRVPADVRASLASHAAGDELMWVATSHFTFVDMNLLHALNNALAPSIGPATTNGPCFRFGSLIECEDQVLGEGVPLSGGEALHYRSSRAFGYSPARRIEFSTDPGTEASGLVEDIVITVDVAGRRFGPEHYPPNAGGRAHIEWDGLDAYGHLVEGSAVASVILEYDYPTNYLNPNPSDDSSFDDPGDGDPIGHARSPNVVARRFEQRLGVIDPRETGVGGWTLTSHHFYDRSGHAIWMGDGTIRDLRPSATQVRYQFPAQPTGWMHNARDGSLLVTRGGRLYRVINGAESLLAGTGDVGGSTGDEGPATSATFTNTLGGVADAPNGDIFVIDQGSLLFGGSCVRRIDTTLTIHAFAGVCGDTSAEDGDGGPALAAHMGGLTAIEVGDDGSVYVASFGGDVIRRIRPDGIIERFAGGGASYADGAPATSIALHSPSALAIDGDGRVLIGDASRIVRILPSPRGNLARGIIGGPEVGDSGDGGAAVAAQVHTVGSILVLPGNEICFADTGNGRVRCITGDDANVDTVVGGGVVPLTDTTLFAFAVPATSVDISGVGSIARTPNGGLAIAVGGIPLETTPIFFLRADGLYQWPSEDGSVIDIFDREGRHLRTVDATVGATLLSFDYDVSGRLTHVTDDSGHVLTVTRDTNGAPMSITGFFGHVHRLTTSADGWIATLTDPLGATWAMPTSADGLLQSFTAPDGTTSTFRYDQGRLSADIGPDARTIGLTYDLTNDGRTVTVTGPRPGQREVYGARASRTPFEHDRTVERLPGQLVVVASDIVSTRGFTLPSGTMISETFAADPRLGTARTYLATQTVHLPSGNETISSERRAVDADDDGELATLPHATDTFTAAGRDTVTEWDPTTRTWTTRFPSGRAWTRTLDDHGRVVATSGPGLFPTTYVYDADGLLESTTVGSGATARVWSATYDHGVVATTTDPLMRTTTYEHDDAGRILSATTADGRTLALTLDAVDRAATITPPGRAAYGLGYSPRGTLTSVTPPTGAGSGELVTTDDGDDPDVRTRGGQHVDYDRDDVSGEMQQVHLARGTFRSSFGTNGLLDALTGPDGQRIRFDHDGDTVTAIHVSGGPASADITFSHDPATGEIDSFDVAGVSIGITRDADGVASQIGDLTLTRDPTSGAFTTTRAAGVTATLAFDGFGEEVSRTYTSGATTLFSSHVTARDALGRITQIVETTGAATHTFAYHYDPTDRLDEVRRDGVVIETYGYHANGARTSYANATGSGTENVDVGERLMTRGAETFAYRDDGALASRTSPAGTTLYEIDELGTLLGVTLADGRHITYDIDPRGRRVGRRVDGTLERAWIYADSNQPVAEADATGTITRVFVYGPSASLAPEYVVEGSERYRLVTDVRGSVRVVTRASDGAVVQRLDYDAYGRVLSDSAPGFQPFGYAGGLYDADTGLVRFAAREYDASTGRWLSMDPAGFEGGLNPYEYAGGDPVNHIDPGGDFIVFLVAMAVGGAILATAAPVVIHGLRTGNWLGCVDTTGLGREFATNFAIEVGTIGVGEIWAGMRAGRAVLASEELAGGCRGGLCSGGCSFGGETDVQTERGVVPIAQIAPGDRVWSLDDETGEWGYHEVTAMTDHVAPALSLELIDDEAAVTESLVVANNHPLFTRARGWVEVGDLLPGDEIFTSRGGWARVGNATWIEGDQLLYDLTVDGTHTYFVGETGAWAHNCAGRSLRGQLRDAHLPGGSHSHGPYRYLAPKGHLPGNPLPRSGAGFVDRFGNVWQRGPYHGNQALDFNFEWDVQLSASGRRVWGGGRAVYINVRPDGFLSH